MITQKQLKNHFHYDPSSGLFTWAIPRRGSKGVGQIAGSINNGGYVTLNLNYKKLLAHRMAWLYVYGRLPMPYIDHIDGDRKNNRISNLREATCLENNRNSCAKGNNKSGVKGVHWNADKKRWTAQIRGKESKKIHLGHFVCINDAEDAYKVASKKFHGEFASQEFTREKAVCNATS